MAAGAVFSPIRTALIAAAHLRRLPTSAAPTCSAGIPGTSPRCPCCESLLEMQHSCSAITDDSPRCGELLPDEPCHFSPRSVINLNRRHAGAERAMPAGLGSAPSLRRRIQQRREYQHAARLLQPVVHSATGLSTGTSRCRFPANT